MSRQWKFFRAEGAERALSDPYAGKERPWKIYLAMAATVFVVAAWWTR